MKGLIDTSVLAAAIYSISKPSAAKAIRRSFIRGNESTDGNWLPPGSSTRKIGGDAEGDEPHPANTSPT
jgi:hypothetical protein